MSVAESPALPRIAVLGAGHSGPVIGRVALDAGYPVSIAASGDPAEIELIAEVLMPGAKPRWAADAVAEADLVVLAIPLHKLTTLDPALVADRLVIDVMNYWPAVDGLQQMPVTWSPSWWRASATTRSGWTACAPVACSSPAAPSSGRR
jgi:8-hydroxy-5-deazaflavin:NADPH oxidoreductase